MKKLFRYVFYTVCIFLLYTRYIQAYIDPSVMTYTIQAVAGMMIALGTFLGIYWRRLRRILQEKYHLDFQTNKEVEKDDFYLYDSSIDQEKITPTIRVSSDPTKEKSSISFRTGFLLSLTISFVWMFYAPLQLYFSNIHEFKYDFYAIIPTILLMFVVGFIVGLLVYYVFHKLHEKAFLLLLLIGVIVLVGSYVQGNFLIQDLPSLDGTAYDWNNHTFGMITSIIWWVLIIGLGINCFMKWNKSQFIFLVDAMCVLLLITCSVTLLTNAISHDGFMRKRSAVVTKENEFVYSTDDNLIILVIDAADGETFHHLLEERKEYKEILKDFTFYPDTVCAYPFTKYSIPFMLTGIWNENQEDFITFETKAMNASPLFHTLESKNYRMGMYEADITYNSDDIFRFENVEMDHYHLNNIAEFARTNTRVTWFLYAPYPLKKYYATVGMISVLQNRASGNGEAFTSLNHDFYQDIKEKPMDVTDEKCFRFIHIDGAHVPFQYDEEVNVIPLEQGSYDLNMKCSMTIIEAYLNKLKEANVYENSSIIILADHGYAEEGETILGRENPLLLIKGKEENHDTMEVSNQPISYDDLQEAYQRLLEGKESKEVFDAKEGEKRSRRFLSYDYTDEKHLYEYYQEGYASDETTLIPTGKIYERK